MSSILEPLTTDPSMLARVRAAWKRLQAPERKGDSQRRVHALEQTVEKARKRLDAAMDSLLDGTIDKAAYDRAVERYTAEAEAATAELASLKEADTAPVLPDLATVLRDASSWQEILAGSDIAAQRDVLALLIEQVVPERVGRGQYEPMITWTPLGAALRQLTEASYGSSVIGHAAEAVTAASGRVCVMACRAAPASDAGSALGVLVSAPPRAPRSPFDGGRPMSRTAAGPNPRTSCRRRHSDAD